MSRRRPRVVQAPMAVTSDGTIIVNAVQLGLGETSPDVMIANARATGLPIFVGVAIPKNMKMPFAQEFDNAVADVVGRLGSRLHR